MAEKCQVFKIKESRLVVRQSLEKPGFFIRNMAKFEAWYFLKNYLQQIKPISKTAYFLPVYERFAMPVSPYQKGYYNKDEMVDLIDQNKVCKEARSLSTLETAAQQAKTKLTEYMGIAIMGIVVLLIIVVLLAASGKIKLGGG